MHNFFFFKMQDISSDIFSDDLKVANYWFNLPFDDKMKKLESLDGMCSELLRTYHEQRKSFENIKEIDEEESLSVHDESDSNA
jgi:hypothetical protein